MKRNYLLLILFLLFGGATLWYLFAYKQKDPSNLGWDRKLKVENEDDIHKIFIANREGETTLLERQGAKWIYNGQYPANPNAIHNILEAATKMELQYVPPKAAMDGIVKELASRGLKVEIYDKAGKKIKAYYVGGVTADARGTYMIMEGSEQPMVMHLPLMEGQIRTRYILTGDEWRDKTIFAYQPEDIESVSVEYPLQRNKSFKLKKQGSSFEVTPFYDNVPPIDKPVDKASAEAFLVGFKSIMAENFLNYSTVKDSIRQVIPFTIISVTDVKGEERSVTLTPSYRIDAATGERTVDEVERYYADVSTGDFMLTQHRVFEKLFWPYEAFFQKELKKVKG